MYLCRIILNDWSIYLSRIQTLYLNMTRLEFKYVKCFLYGFHKLSLLGAFCSLCGYRLGKSFVTISWTVSDTNFGWTLISSCEMSFDAVSDTDGSGIPCTWGTGNIAGVLTVTNGFSSVLFSSLSRDEIWSTCLRHNTPGYTSTLYDNGPVL